MRESGCTHRKTILLFCLGLQYKRLDYLAKSVENKSEKNVFLAIGN